MLTVAAALCVSGCVSSRKATSDVRWNMSDVRSDTVREQVVVTVFDTITITKTITIRESESGDTLRMTTVTDKTKATTHDRYHDVQEKVVVRTDTVYVEREVEKTVAVAGPNTEIDKDGNIRHHTSAISLLHWLFLTLLAIIAIIILIRIKH